VLVAVWCFVLPGRFPLITHLPTPRSFISYYAHSGWAVQCCRVEVTCGTTVVAAALAHLVIGRSLSVVVDVFVIVVIPTVVI